VNRQPQRGKRGTEAGPENKKPHQKAFSQAIEYDRRSLSKAARLSAE